jgi:hypothetical protein
MDNIEKKNNKIITTKKLLKKRFIKNMKTKNVNIERYLNSGQLTKLANLKVDMDDDVILDESIKQSETDRITLETSNLNNLMLFLREKLHPGIISLLKKTGEMSNTDSFIKDIPLGLKYLTGNLRLRNPNFDSYSKTLLKSDKVDFSLFYFGSQDDIFNLVYESFIEHPKILFKYNNQWSRTIINEYNKAVKSTDTKYYKKKELISSSNSNYEDTYIILNKSKISSYPLLNEEKTIDYYNNIHEDYDSHSLSKGYQDILRYIYPDFEIEKQKYPINICKHFRFEEIVKLLNSDIDKKEDFKKHVINEINKNFEKEYSKIYNFYLHYLNIDYVKKTKPEIEINSDNIRERTLKQIQNYLVKIKDVLIEIINSDDFSQITKDYIREKYREKLDGNYTSGFLLSTLYNFHKKDNYNIKDKYVENLKTLHKNKNLNSNINECHIYFNIKRQKIEHLSTEELQKLYSQQYGEDKNFRMVLTNKQMQNLHNIYKDYFKNIVLIFEKLIQKYEISQQKYLYVLDLLIINDKQTYEYTKEEYIKREFSLYLKGENLQTSIDVIITSKVYFSKIIFELNEKLLRLIKDDNNLSDRYNRFITEYSLWVIYIIKYISTYPDDSKQIYHFEKILQMFINDKDIKNWYNSCVKNNLHYWLPVFYKGNSNYSFFINLITNEKSYKIKSNDLIIVKYKNSNIKQSDDEVCSWDNNRQNIIVDDSYDRILIFIKKYIKCNSPLDMNDFNVIKSLVTRCDKKKADYNRIIKNKMKLVHKSNKLSSISNEISKLNKELALSEEIEYDCKHLISYHLIIKEIIKIKYPFKVDDSNNLTNLNITVREYQQKLYNQIPKHSII